jgi:hypothetical protein
VYRLLAFILLFIVSFGSVKAQPFTPVPGSNITITRSGDQYKLFVPSDYATCDSLDLYLHVFYTGDGTSAAGTENQVMGKWIKSGGPWNGRVLLNNGDTARVCILSIPGTYGFQPGKYGDVIKWTIESLTRLGTNLGGTTPIPGHFSVAGLSGGPARAIHWLDQDTSAIRALFKRGVFMSNTPIGLDFSWSTGGNWFVWWNRSDPNGGTAPIDAINLYVDLNGTKDSASVDIPACHCNTIWDSCMTVVGLDSHTGGTAATNRIRRLIDPSDGVGNVGPVANAGADQGIVLPTSSVTVNGSGSSDPDGTITDYLWTKISGPSTFTITTPTSVSTSITGLVLGVYVFRLQVTDNEGDSDTDEMTVTVSSVPSTTRVFPNIKRALNRNGRKGYNAERLIDNDTLTKVDGTGGISDPFSTPWESWIILDSFYSNMKVMSWQAFGAGGFVVTVLTDDGDNHMIEADGSLDTGDSLGQFTITISAFQDWVTKEFTTFENIRALRFQAATYADKTSGIWELRFYGDQQGVAPTIYRTETIIANTDPGKYAHGMGLIDDKNTDTARRMANSFRVGYPATNTDSQTVNKVLPLLDPNFVYKYDWFGYNNYNTRIFNTARLNDIKVQNYIAGANIKYLSDIDAATHNYGVWSTMNNYKYIEPGSDSTSRAAWAGKARLWRQYVGLFGTNTSYDLSSFLITGMPVVAGQGGLEAAEIDNEDTKDWQFGHGFFSPTVTYQMLDTVVPAIKEVDATMPVFIAALTFMDTTYVKAMFLENWLRYGTTRAIKWDGWCFNIYMNNAYDGQQIDAPFNAITPERWKFKSRLTKLGLMMDELFPNHSRIRITEYGFSTDSTGSGFDVPAISGKTREQTKGDWSVRYGEIASIKDTAESVSLNGHVERKFYYFYSGDGTGGFDRMNATNWNGSADTMMPVGKLLVQQRLSVQDYNFWSTLLLDGDSTSNWITRRNATIGTNKLFTVWRGTYTNSTSSQIVSVGANALTATLKTMNYGTTVTTNTPLVIAGNQVTVTARETPQYIEVTYLVVPAVNRNYFRGSLRNKFRNQ